ncbi:L,D-transpeptidase [Coraliomargarita sp. SDUM461004]|uniref:L,D-transpeptidase n=1 Tax=Thalassobacterium sedimentorum TaxID=3041258 RepID=A0ABU1ADR9_9BACT|nr:L,D-transpeptidase [Coraliomargarita sp. SDUM461004]MDQ8192872.1 L,D-transpeptidase [Coraliomargarita sp. SDUM461004]
MLRQLLSLVCLAILAYAAYLWLPQHADTYDPAQSHEQDHAEQASTPSAPKPPTSKHLERPSTAPLRAQSKTSSAALPQTPGRPIVNTLELQMALARKGFSPGSIDGTIGTQTRQAIRAYQIAHNLSPTGEFDVATQAVLQITDPIYDLVTLSQSHFSRIDPPPLSWKERATRSRMAYYSILEMLAESCMSDPDLLQQLNPNLDFNALQADDRILIPNMAPVQLSTRADYLQISLSERTLQAIDSQGRILFHCPVSIARRVDKRPSGALHVKVLVEKPNYTFNPAILSSAAAREGITQKFVIEPGPNNPVGNIWIGLNLPSYGIHGTPEPEKVGRTESSGCFRLANWNAQTLIDLVEVGTMVQVTP